MIYLKRTKNNLKNKLNHEDYRILIKMNIHFFEGEKTENATAKKKGEARKEGQVAKSMEIPTAFMFIAMFSSLGTFSSYMYKKLFDFFNYNISIQADYRIIFNKKFLGEYITYSFAQVLLIAAPLFAVAMAVGVVTNVVQVGWNPTLKPLKPKFSKLNPISGFKRMFSLKAILDLFKAVAKFSIICYVVYNIVKDQLGYLPLMYEHTLQEIMVFIGSLIIKIGINVGIVYFIVAIVDYVYTRWKHNKDLKMSKQEIKEEYKNSEGNPQVKGKIRQKMREASMRRMMSDLPTADVIITNPTHYAVAVKYDRAKSEAPIVVAKGADHMAKRIREVGKENEIQIVENKPLARTLYSTVDIGQEIPPELYKAVAEILAYVYKLREV